MSKPLDGRIAVVTAGAGSGIGGTIVRRLLSDGASVHVSDSHAGRLGKIGAELGVATTLLDVADGDALAAYLAGVERDAGRIDILVNCAGANVVKPTWELTDQEWHDVFTVNVDAPFRAARSVLPGMIERGVGSIVSIASIAAWGPEAKEVAYSTTKATLVAFTRALANEVAALGIRVNAVAPGFVENPFLEKLYGKERMDALRAATPQGRGVYPSEVAAAVAWLAGDDASFVTGETITVAGGSFFRAG
jgi:NAD(P)-dependent dehydrogenase (short-subunit alcohol dehydrogenase family)